MLASSIYWLTSDGQAFGRPYRRMAEAISAGRELIAGVENCELGIRNIDGRTLRPIEVRIITSEKVSKRA